MAYIGKQPGTGVRNRFLYTATAGQTTFTTSDSNLALSYSDALYMDVYLNGVLLDPANDYTATSGTSIVLGSGASAGDILEVIVYDVFSVFNNTIDGNFEVGGNTTLDNNLTVGGDLTVDTNTLHVDSTNNRVGIGTLSPTQALELNFTGYGGMVVNSTDNAGLAAIRFDSTAGAQLNQVQSGHMEFRTADTERMRILAGGGLTFNGDTAAANALDDYEEGTWTPVFQGTGSNPTVSYNIQVGRYVKVGTVITVSCRLRTASVTGGSGNLLIGGLPFAAVNVTALAHSGSIGYSSLYTTVAPQTAHLAANGTQASMICNSGADGRFSLQTAVGTGNLTNTNGANDTMMTMTYITG